MQYGLAFFSILIIPDQHVSIRAAFLVLMKDVEAVTGSVKRLKHA
jgi:hypothetical protein